MSQRKRQAKNEPASKGKRKKSDNDEASQSQSQSGSQKKPKDLSSLSKKEKEQKIKDIVRRVVFTSNAKRPISFKELKEAMTPFEHVTEAVIEEANKRLKKVFGLELVEMPELKEGQLPTRLNEALSYSSGPSTKSYFLLNNLPLTMVSDANSQHEEESKDMSQTGLLMCVLAMIYVQKMEATQSQLDAFLKDLRVLEKRKHDAIEEDAKGIISKFIAQRYLRRITPKGSGDAKVTYYRWGARARAEIEEEQIVSFIATLFNADETEWTNQIAANNAISDSQQASTSA
eukprot:m.260542 g.260542  ORF g.260542 m.260542 type:complete len:288 (-) comp40082_c0_seq1:28-891(-)